MKFFSSTAVLSFLVAINFMSNVAVAVPVESSSDGTLARLVKRQVPPIGEPPAPESILDEILNEAGRV
ncbi:hypothetical protein AX14_004969 [Amanita brunnescens Koide BX004]|nr:hypothetical protein AX14_004969 [Amanita brunnescens Koide BX004]